MSLEPRFKSDTFKLAVIQMKSWVLTTSGPKVNQKGLGTFQHLPNKSQRFAEKQQKETV